MLARLAPPASACDLTYSYKALPPVRFVVFLGGAHGIQTCMAVESLQPTLCDFGTALQQQCLQKNVASFKWVYVRTALLSLLRLQRPGQVQITAASLLHFFSFLVSSQCNLSSQLHARARMLPDTCREASSHGLACKQLHAGDAAGVPQVE